MDAHRQRTTKTIFDILIVAVGLLLLWIFLNAAQTELSIRRQEDNFSTKLDIAQQRMAQNEDEAADNLVSFDAFSQAKLDSVVYFLDTHADYPKTLALSRQWGLDELYLLDGKGDVTFSTGATPHMAAEPLNALLETKEPVTAGDVRYYIRARLDGGYAVGARACGDELATLRALCAPERALSTIQVGAAGFIMAVEPETQTVAYFPETAFIGQPVSRICRESAQLTDGWEGWLTLEGRQYYGRTRAVGAYVFTALVPEAEMTSANRGIVAPVLVVFGAALSLLAAYALILRRDQSRNPASAPEYIQLGKRLYFNKTMGGKMWNVAAVCLVAIVALSYYLQTLGALSRQSVISANKLQAVTEILDDNQARIAALTEEYGKEYAGRAANIAWTLNEDPSLIGDETLGEMAKQAQIAAVYVFDGAGRVVATNTPYKDFVLSDAEDDQSYPFWSVVKGYTDAYVQEAQPDDTPEGNLMQYVGVKRLDDKGMVQLGMLPRRLKTRLAATEQDYVLRSIAVENGGYLFAVNKADGTFLTHPKEKYTGRPADEYGLTADALRDEFSGYQTIDGTKCFVACAEYGDAYLYTAVPVAALFAGRLQITLLVGAGGLAVILLICAFLLLSRSVGQPAPENGPNGPENPVKQQPRRFFRVVSPGGKSRVVQSASSRWSGHTKWSDRTPEQKLSRLLALALGAAAIAIALWIVSGSAENNAMFAYILSTKWERTPNIFSLTYVLLVGIETLVASGILRRLILFATSRFGARSETVGRLLDSFIKYAAVIGVLFYGLNYIGVDSTALMTSAGILALVVGLGAQKLIGDILAGIFIVFEGEFRVGDIVTVGDWCGTVLEIGIRTTKIQSGGSDIKIVNNSAISGVVNMTKQYSYATVDIGIEYNESLERVESVLNRELPQVKQRVPSVVSGPFYKGVASLGDSAVVIRIVAQCKEKDRVQLVRDLNRELKLICDRNNVSIPFPQVVINRPAEHGQATRREKREAAEFVTEQKELSKDIEAEEEP